MDDAILNLNTVRAVSKIKIADGHEDGLVEIAVTTCLFCFSGSVYFSNCRKIYSRLNILVVWFPETLRKHLCWPKSKKLFGVGCGSLEGQGQWMGLPMPGFTVPLQPYCCIETLGMQMNNGQITYNSRTGDHNLYQSAQGIYQSGKRQPIISQTYRRLHSTSSDSLRSHTMPHIVTDPTWPGLHFVLACLRHPMLAIPSQGII